MCGEFIGLLPPLICDVSLGNFASNIDLVNTSVSYVREFADKRLYCMFPLSCVGNFKLTVLRIWIGNMSGLYRALVHRRSACRVNLTDVWSNSVCI